VPLSLGFPAVPAPVEPPTCTLDELLNPPVLSSLAHSILYNKRSKPRGFRRRRSRATRRPSQTEAVPLLQVRVMIPRLPTCLVSGLLDRHHQGHQRFLMLRTSDDRVVAFRCFSPPSRQLSSSSII
jgi:hypothetical protein